MTRAEDTRTMPSAGLQLRHRLFDPRTEPERRVSANRIDGQLTHLLGTPIDLAVRWTSTHRASLWPITPDPTITDEMAEVTAFP